MESMYYTELMRLDELDPEYLGKLVSRIENSYDVKESGCWEWNKGRLKAGYGKVAVKRHTRGPHRVYYQLMRGFVPDNLVMSHKCDNPPCINPDHLEPTTQWENNAKGNGPSAQNLRKTQCVNGHSFSPENTIMGINRRACRTCKLGSSHRRDIERTKEYHARGLNSKGKPMSEKWKRKYGLK